MTDLWPFRPGEGCTESLEWFTEINGGLTGEQRLALRSAPRQMLNYTTRLLDYQQYARAKIFARRNGALPVYVPVWGEHQQIGVVAAVDTVLTFDTTWGDWRVGSLLVVYEDDENYELCEIDAVTATDITLTAAVGTSFTAAAVAPVRTAITTNGFEMSRANKTKSDISVVFVVVDNIDLAATYVSAYPQYQSLDVMTDPPVLMTDVSESIIRAAEYVDNGFGPIVVETTKNYTDFGQTLSFHDDRGPIIWQRRLWLHALRGKQKTFWLPSFNHDLELQASFASGATTLTVRSLTDATGVYIGRHIMIQLTNGDRYFREITNAASVGGGNDSLVISSSLGVAVAPADVVQFCFISLVRLDTDTVDIEHSYPLCSAMSIRVMEVPE